MKLGLKVFQVSEGQLLGEAAFTQHKVAHAFLDQVAGRGQTTKINTPLGTETSSDALFHFRLAPANHRGSVNCGSFILTETTWNQPLKCSVRDSAHWVFWRAAWLDSDTAEGLGPTGKEKHKLRLQLEHVLIRNTMGLHDIVAHEWVNWVWLGQSVAEWKQTRVHTILFQDDVTFLPSMVGWNEWRNGRTTDRLSGAMLHKSEAEYSDCLFEISAVLLLLLLAKFHSL